MQKKDTPHELFEKELAIQFQSLEKVSKAKIDKSSAGFELSAIDRELNIARELFVATQREMGTHCQFLLEIQWEMQDDKEKKFSTSFDQKFASILNNEKNILLKKLSRLAAIEKLIGYLVKENRKYFPLNDRKDKDLSTNIKWKGTTELEFVQLIYALNEAMYLDNKEEEITTLVKQVAKAFNYKLGKNWQSNLSKSINNRKSGYKSKIFENLTIAFETYRERQINKRK